MTTEHEEFAAFAATAIAATSATDPAPVEAEKTASTETPEDAAKPDAAKPEAKPPEKPPEKKVDWKELAAKEQVRRAAKAASRTAAVQKDRELVEARAKAERLDRIMHLSKDKRMAALAEIGITVDQVNDEYIRDLEADPNRPTPQVAAMIKENAEIKAELKAWREEKADEKAKSETKALESQRKSIEATYTTKAAGAIQAKPDEYEVLSKHPQGSEVVFHFIAAHYAQTSTIDADGNVIVPGEELEMHEACRRVEALLFDDHKWTSEVKKLRGSSRASDSTTLSGDVRQSEPQSNLAVDDNNDNEFNQMTLRLLKQHTA